MEGVGLVTGFQFFSRLAAVLAEEVADFSKIFSSCLIGLRQISYPFQFSVNKSLLRVGMDKLASNFCPQSVFIKG